MDRNHVRALLIVGGSLILLIAGFCFLSTRPRERTVANLPDRGSLFESFAIEKRKLPGVPADVSLAVVGDVMLSRTVAQSMSAHGDVNYPFLNVADFLRSADMTFGNLEHPITSGRAIESYDFVLRADPGVEQVLARAGFNIVSLANNHAMDFGASGLIDTLRYLDEANITYAGAGEDAEEAYGPAYVERNGLTFAFLAYNDTDAVPADSEATQDHAGTAFMRAARMAESVKRAKQRADFVIVSMHAGTEYAEAPNDLQVAFAHRAIDAGAELVIGHHPHVIQPIEKYRDKFILYSLGNFVFDQTLPGTRDGLAAKISFGPTGVRRLVLLPVSIKNFSQPVFVDDESVENVFRRITYPIEDTVVYEWDEDTGIFMQKMRKMIPSTQAITGNLPVIMRTADSNQDGEPEEYALKQGKLILRQSGETVWESPDDWWVDDVVLADANADGIVDVNLSVWKSWSFGSSKPFWVEEDDPSVKNHFFVFDFIDDTIKPVWQSSNLAAPNCAFDVADIDGDNKNELIVIEGSYEDKPLCNGKFVAVWEWNGWGFTNAWRSREGGYRDIELLPLSNRIQVMVHGE